MRSGDDEEEEDGGRGGGPRKKARFVWEIKGRYRVREGQPPPAEEDDPIRLDAVLRWRNQQMAKAVFDNTVNSVIENMGFSFPEIETLMDTYGGGGRAGRRRGDGEVEDEAVRMAIRSHGLTKACSCPAGGGRGGGGPSRVPFHQRPPPGAPWAAGPSFARPQPPTNEVDFLSEAVAVAIQKKGLSKATDM